MSKAYKTVREILADREKESVWQKIKREIRCFFRFNDWYWTARSWIIPQHKEIRATVPRKWSDVDSIIENVIFAAFLSWAKPDGEDGLFPQYNQMADAQDKLNKLEFYRFARGYDGSYQNKIKELEEFFNKKWGCNGEEHARNYCDDRLKKYEKFKEIYNWLLIGRDIEQKIIDQTFEDDHCNEWIQQMKDMENKIDEYVIFIVKNRGHLWT